MTSTPAIDVPARPVVALRDRLAALLGDGDVLVLTGAGISTDSGIPDYRGRDGVRRHAAPMTHDVFTSTAAARQRYWARAHLGWRRVGEARPNAGHRAVASLEQAGRLTGTVTQNVDGLHQAAGSSDVVDLHGRLDRVVCLGCGDVRPRLEVALRLEALNPGWREAVTAAVSPPAPTRSGARHGGGTQQRGGEADPPTRSGARHGGGMQQRGDESVPPTRSGARHGGGTQQRGGESVPPTRSGAGHGGGTQQRGGESEEGVRPDGDVALRDELVAGFRTVDCRACGGVLKPDVVYFGDRVPRERFADALGRLERSRTLLVLGSSLMVGSGYRFATRAARLGVPIAIVNRGVTRADHLATVRLDAGVSETLGPLAATLAG